MAIFEWINSVFDAAVNHLFTCFRQRSPANRAMKFTAALAAKIADRRASRGRRALRLEIELRDADGRTVNVRVRNIAENGLLLETDSPILSVGDVIEVELPDKGLVSAEVKWAAPPFFGCQLDSLLTAAQLAAALLKADPMPYRLTQEGEAIAQGTVQQVRSDPVPDFSKPFMITALFWVAVAIGLLALG